MTATVYYKVGMYEGTIHLNCDPNEDNEYIIARAKKILLQQAKSFPLGIYYESWKVTARTEYNNS